MVNGHTFLLGYGGAAATNYGTEMQSSQVLDL